MGHLKEATLRANHLLILVSLIIAPGCDEPEQRGRERLDAMDSSALNGGERDSRLGGVRLDSTILPDHELSNVELLDIGAEGTDSTLSPRDMTLTPSLDMETSVDAFMEVETPLDAEIPDAEILDAEILDAEILDAEILDAEILDAELLDAELLDAELLDAELLDAELLDAELLDAETLPEPQERPECVSDLSHFYSAIWRPIIRERCAGCHNQEGAAQDTDMVYTLIRDTIPIRRQNFEAFQNISDLYWSDIPLALAKAQGLIEHGGGEVLREDDPAIEAINEMLQRMDDPAQDDCPDWFGELGSPFFAGLILAEGQVALKQVALHLAGRLPTEDEGQLVQQYGEVGFELVLNRMVRSTGFYERMRELWNDLLLTDKYLNINPLSIFDYPDMNWYSSPAHWESALTPEMQQLGYQYTVSSVAREPIKHIIYLLKNDRPFTEIISADYIAMNPYTARFYGVDDIDFDDPWDPEEYRAGRVPTIPHAGILTSPIFLSRYPTSTTNRNRHRARTFLRIFLDYDIFGAANSNVDTRDLAHNPTMNDPQCLVCHEIMDPIAGAFQNWNETGGYVPPIAWHQNMRAPGFGGRVVPIDRQRESLRWLAEEVAETPQFDRAMVHLVYSMLTGRRFEERPVNSDPLFDAKMQLYETQQAFAHRLAQGFRSSGHDLRFVITQIAKSPWFLAIDYIGELDAGRVAQLEAMGRGRTLTPEQLFRKLQWTTGHRWRSRHHSASIPYLLNPLNLKLLYGAIDSDQVIDRIRHSSAVFASIQQMVANATSCEASPAEFHLMDLEPQTPRLLLPFIDGRESLIGPDGEHDPEVSSAIKENLRYLFWHLWNEEVELTSPDLLELYQLFVELQISGQAAIASGEQSDLITTHCDGRVNLRSGLAFEVVDRSDPDYTIRAWQTLIFTFLVDHKFVLE